MVESLPLTDTEFRAVASFRLHAGCGGLLYSIDSIRPGREHLIRQMCQPALGLTGNYRASGNMMTYHVMPVALTFGQGTECNGEAAVQLACSMQLHGLQTSSYTRQLP